MYRCWRAKELTSPPAVDNHFNRLARRLEINIVNLLFQVILNARKMVAGFFIIPKKEVMKQSF
ncbi:MAG: hypothetical protein C4542_06255 [Dehalococcoidia bacterium]|nr:MAG: hypothetical protein C4542_06255 [Dehalococcoidia bacterium]